jgi:hypothetical protein
LQEYRPERALYTRQNFLAKTTLLVRNDEALEAPFAFGAKSFLQTWKPGSPEMLRNTEKRCNPAVSEFATIPTGRPINYWLLGSIPSTGLALFAHGTGSGHSRAISRRAGLAGRRKKGRLFGDSALLTNRRTAVFDWSLAQLP